MKYESEHDPAATALVTDVDGAAADAVPVGSGKAEVSGIGPAADPELASSRVVRVIAGMVRPAVARQQTSSTVSRKRPPCRRPCGKLCLLDRPSGERAPCLIVPPSRLLSGLSPFTGTIGRAVPETRLTSRRVTRKLTAVAVARTYRLARESKKSVTKAIFDSRPSDMPLRPVVAPGERTLVRVVASFPSGRAAYPYELGRVPHGGLRWPEFVRSLIPARLGRVLPPTARAASPPTPGQARQTIRARPMPGGRVPPEVRPAPPGSPQPVDRRDRIPGGLSGLSVPASS